MGMSLFRAAGLLTGGTAGVAFLVHYATGWPFGLVFFAVNLPFYALAWRAFGAAFTLKTFAAIALVSAAAEAIPRLVAFARIEPWFAAVIGRCMIGAGLLCCSATARAWAASTCSRCCCRNGTAGARDGCRWPSTSPSS